MLLRLKTTTDIAERNPMARGINKVILVGNLGKDPETRYFPDGGAITNVTIATSESWKDKNSGEQQERTEWHKVTFRGRLAEIAGEYLRKGSKVYVEGKLQTRKWQDQSGQDRYTTEIQANELQMLDSRNGGGDDYNQAPRQSAPRQQNNNSGYQQQGNYQQQQQQPAQQQNYAPQTADLSAGFDDDIPF